jgi:hypothetical protein
MMSEGHRGFKARTLETTKRKGLRTEWLRATMLAVGAVVVTFCPRTGAADDQPGERAIFSYQIGEDGSIQSFWASGVDVFDKGVEMVSVPVPTDMAEIIKDAVANPENYVGKFEYVLVITGSTRAARCHPHEDGSMHCPGN